MKIIIAGAGEVGFHLAKMLSMEDHDIVLIDKVDDRLRYAESNIDVRTLRGNAISIRLLGEAGVAEADLMIAATSIEEVNITTAIIAKKLGVKRTIARISNPEFLQSQEVLDLYQMGIDNMVFPEDLAASEIHRLMRLSGLTEAFEFGDGKLVLTGLILENQASLTGKSVMEVAKIYPEMDFTIVAVQRKGKTVIPRGDTELIGGDHVYFVSNPDYIDGIRSLSGKDLAPIRKIMILGGSRICRRFCEKANHEFQLKLIDSDEQKCIDLADQFPNVMVIHGDGTNVDLLEEEGIGEMDAFIAVTDDSETNIISCLVAKTHGVARTVALVENFDYISLSQSIGIDTLINKKVTTISEIYRHLRQGQVESVTSLPGLDAEVLEFSVSASCKITNNPIKKLQFPREAIIAGIIRGEESFAASGDNHIQDGDRVVVFTLPGAVKKVEAFFM